MFHIIVQCPAIRLYSCKTMKYEYLFPQKPYSYRDVIRILEKALILTVGLMVSSTVFFPMTLSRERCPINGSSVRKSSKRQRTDRKSSEISSAVSADNTSKPLTDLKPPTSLQIRLSSRIPNGLFQHVRISGRFSFISTRKCAGDRITSLLFLHALLNHLNHLITIRPHFIVDRIIKIAQ